SPNKAVPGPFAYSSPPQRTVLRTAIRGEPDTATSHSSQPTLQRKSNCSCGGSCPKCRAPSDAITQLGQVNINPNHIRLGSQDPIHQPLIDN
ncbi:MAG: hypothetical protein ACE5GO_09025, partial [Anaerolineales bacterium]